MPVGGGSRRSDQTDEMRGPGAGVLPAHHGRDPVARATLGAGSGIIGARKTLSKSAMAWQNRTVYFAVIELVAAVGLWLATPWGAVVC